MQPQHVPEQPCVPYGGDIHYFGCMSPLMAHTQGLVWNGDLANAMTAPPDCNCNSHMHKNSSFTRQELKVQLHKL